MRLPSILSLTGFLLVIIATFCPMLRPFHLFSWNVYDMNRPFGVTLLLVSIMGMLGVFFNQPKIMRIAAWAVLVLALLLYIAAVLKVNTSFSFIPFKSWTSFLANQIKFKWGWYTLFTGAGAAILGALLSKRPVSISANPN